MNKQRLRRAARQDAANVAKIIGIQEKQIADLQQQVTALEAVITGVAALTFDWVDPVTGEIEKRPLLIITHTEGDSEC